MKVPQEILQKWKDSIDTGDKDQLRIYCKCSHPIITKAFKGIASKDLILKISTFCNIKKKSLENNLKKIN